MTKNFIVLFALCALALVALPACSDGEKSEPRIEATAEMTKTFSHVSDKKSADEAAQKFLAFSARLEQLPPTSPEATDRAEFAVGRLFSQISRLRNNDFFESDALKNALYGASVPAEKAEEK